MKLLIFILLLLLFPFNTLANDVPPNCTIEPGTGELICVEPAPPPVLIPCRLEPGTGDLVCIVPAPPSFPVTKFKPPKQLKRPGWR